MAKLVLKRIGNAFINGARDYIIKLDGNRLGGISNNEVLEFEIPAGKHQLQSSIDWLRSSEITFEIKENETKFVEIGLFKGYKLIFLLLPSLWLPGVLTKRFFADFYAAYPVLDTIQMAVSLLTLLGFAYAFFVKRKNYLQMSFVK